MHKINTFPTELKSLTLSSSKKENRKNNYDKNNHSNNVKSLKNVLKYKVIVKNYTPIFSYWVLFHVLHAKHLKRNVRNKLSTSKRSLSA